MKIRIRRCPSDVGQSKAEVIIKKIAFAILMILIFYMFDVGYDTITSRIRPLKELNELFCVFADEDTGEGTGIIDFLGMVFAAILTYIIYNALKLHTKKYWSLFGPSDDSLNRDKMIIILEEEFKLRSKIDNLLKIEKMKEDLPSRDLIGNTMRSWDLEEVKKGIEYVLSLWENPYCWRPLD